MRGTPGVPNQRYPSLFIGFFDAEKVISGIAPIPDYAPHRYPAASLPMRSSLPMNRDFPDLAPPGAGYGLAILLSAAMLIGFFVGLSVAACVIVG
jgi:hypothetical protein